MPPRDPSTVDYITESINQQIKPSMRPNTGQTSPRKPSRALEHTDTTHGGFNYMLTAEKWFRKLNVTH